MDTTQTITHLGLCAGYGGIELGLKRVLPALRTVALCEIEAFACANLVAKMEAGFMDAAPIWTDLKTFPWEEFRDRVDILTGGYPCQPFSNAGKRLGTDDPRHLWPYIASGIRLMRPRVCFFENVEGHISLGLREVISELEQMGYETTWGIFSAAECGAPHQRKRVFILAHRIDAGSQGWLRGWPDSGREDQHGRAGCSGAGVHGWWPSRPGQPQRAWEPPRVVGDSKSPRANRGHQFCAQECGQGRALSSEFNEPSESVGNAESEQDNGREPRDLGLETSQGGCSNHAAGGSSASMGNAENKRCGRLDDEPSQTSGWKARGHADGTSTEQQQEQRQAKPTLGGATDGPACGMDYAELYTTCDNRTDELRLLGNGVVPATAELAFRTLMQQL